MVGLSLGEQTFIKGGIYQDLRTDGRKRLTYSPIFVETGIIPQASGSARVKLGATDVIASAELGKPNPSYPDKGKVSIHVDCSPTAEPSFEVYEMSFLSNV
ncbi:exosome complex exonuclease RRP42-like [Salvia splendens]|uniref:exosome complex exonuclease RRP42-like n=1 Tax=Salvia splendens TaxID=180675 RepID=UPI001C26C747|nr:exosome complex exonuclease RRP42-like [Salvia splendens]